MVPVTSPNINSINPLELKDCEYEEEKEKCPNVSSSIEDPRVQPMPDTQKG